MVTKANLLERRSRYDKYGAGVPDGRVTDEYPTPLLFKEAQTPLNENPPQVTSPGSIASGMSQEGQNEIVPPAVVTTDNPHAGMDNKDGGDMPERDNYHFYADLVDQYTKKPMTPEEEERRKRSATAVEGIGHFGNVLNAFSNLVFTGQGAPSQTLSKVPAGELQKFEDRVAENRRRYIGARMDADARDRSDWLDNWRNEYQRQKDEADKQAKLDERAYDLMKFNANLSKEQAREQARKELEEARLKETERHNKAMENISRSRANSENKSGTKIVESAKDNKGDTWGRSSKLTSKEAKRLVESYYNDDVNLESFRKYRVGSSGEKIPGEIDYDEVVAYMENKGLIPPEEWESMGFKRTVPKREQKLNWGKNENETDW